VVADDATCGSAENAMMTSNMPCNASHQCAFDAPFGLGWCRYGDKCDCNRGASKSLVHHSCSNIEVVIKQRGRRKSSS
jgi:hypothetical protein